MKKPRNPPAARPGLQFERLEERTPLAGDVFAAFSGENLKITGTNDGNRIRVSSVGNEIRVTTFLNTSGDAIVQTLNKPASGIVRNVTIDMKGADDPNSTDPQKFFDAVELQNLVLKGKLSVKSGKGLVLNLINIDAPNAVTIKSGTGPTQFISGATVVPLQGSLITMGSSGGNVLGYDVFQDKSSSVSITTGKSPDIVALVNADLGKVTVSTSDGSDSVGVGSSTTISGVTLHDKLTVKSGAGDDVVLAGSTDAGRFSTFRKDVLIDLGTGAGTNDLAFVAGTLSNGTPTANSTSSTNFLGKLTIKGGAGSKSVGLLGVRILGDISITTNSGVDVIGLVDVAALAKLTISSGAGNDAVALGGNLLEGAFIGGKTSIKTGNDADKIFFDDSTFVDLVSVTLGSGFDEYLSSSTTYNKNVVVNGGSEAEGNRHTEFIEIFNDGATSTFKGFVGPLASKPAFIAAIDSLFDARFGAVV